MQRTQSESAVSQAQAQLGSARARLAAAEAAAKLQTAQTPTDIARARTAVAVAQAALSTAESNRAQVLASANLQIATAQEQLRQAQANAHNAGLNLQRQQALLQKGFVAASLVDDAQAAATVSQSQVDAAQQNVLLVKAKVAADLQAARDQVVQAQQNLEASHAALAAAQAGTNSVDAKQAEVGDARAQVRQAQANLATALGNIAQIVLKQLDAQAARATVGVAQAQVNYYQAQLQKTYIRTPISGTVLQLATQQGETLAAGLSAPTLIIVADLNRLEVDAYVDETDIGKVVRRGQEAEVTVDAFPGHAYQGEVSKIAAGSTIQQGVVTYVVGISLQDPKHRLRPDMTASVTIKTGERANVLLVPAEAVKQSTRHATVNVLVRKNGKTEIERRRVQTGGSDGVNTEIRSGLQEGETVVLAGLEDSQKRHAGSSPFGPQKKEKKKARDEEVSDASAHPQAGTRGRHGAEAAF